jgi:hypothetical protein
MNCSCDVDIAQMFVVFWLGGRDTNLHLPVPDGNFGFWLHFPLLARGMALPQDPQQQKSARWPALATWLIRSARRCSLNGGRGSAPPFASQTKRSQPRKFRGRSSGDMFFYLFRSTGAFGIEMN